MVELPQELWLEIASHLPRKVLYKMRTLNSLFLNLALNDKYGVGQARYPGELRTVLFLKYLRYAMSLCLWILLLSYQSGRHLSRSLHG